MTVDAQALEKIVLEAKEDDDVLAVILFGSVARGKSGPDSDVDICLVLEDRPYEAAALSQRKLHYLSRFDLDVQIFQQLPLYVRRRVLKEGRVLWARDEERLYDVAFRAVRAFELFRPRYEDYLRTIARGGS
jgi:predicted nucleotidyltransferase